MGISHIWWACPLSLLIVIAVGAKALWDSKRAPFFVLREEAEARMRRVAPVALALLVVNASLLAWKKWGSVPLSEIIPTPMPTLTSIPGTPVSPGLSPKTGSPTPVATSTPSPTFTFSQVPTPTVKPPAPTPTERLEASFGVITLAQGVSEENLPLEPGDIFPEGTKQVYAFFSYTEMEMGTPWTQAWYRGEQKLWSQTKRWRLGREGNAWIYMEFIEGLPPGEYEVRLYIDRKLQQRVEFTAQ